MYLLAEGPEDELSLEHQFVRDLKPLGGNDLIFVEEDVEVNIPWPFIHNLHPAHIIFDRLQLVEELDGRQWSFDLPCVSTCSHGVVVGSRTWQTPFTNLS